MPSPNSPKTLLATLIFLLFVTSLLASFLAANTGAIAVSFGLAVAVTISIAHTVALTDTTSRCAEFSSMGFDHGLQRVTF